MPQRALLLALVLLLCGAAAFAWLMGDNAPVPLAPGEAVPQAPAGTPDAAATTSGGTPADATTSSDDARAIAAVLDAADARPLPANPVWVKVRIVDQATGAPVPDAVVAWTDETSWDWLRDHHRLDNTEGAIVMYQGLRFPDLAGWRTRSDAAGYARVTLQEHTTVLARHEDRFGRRELRGNTATPVNGFTIEIEPDTAITVRVVDAAGMPRAGVPVTVAMQDANGNMMTSLGWQPMARSRAPDGLATIPHLVVPRREVDRARTPEWRVRLFLIGSDDPGVLFDPQAPPAEPLTLRLPPFGSMRVRAEFAGKPFPGFRTAYLQELRELPGRRYQVGTTADVGPDGFARFAFVPLAQQFGVSTPTTGLGGTFDGPQFEGQDAEVVLSTSDTGVVLTGRLLRPDRSPFADGKTRVRITGQGVHHTDNLMTDAEGRFLVIVDNDANGKRADQIWFDVEAKGEPPRRAEVQPRSLRTGVDELGDLILGDGTVLVAGRLVSRGEPYLGRASLRIERQDVGDGTRPPRWRRIDGALEHRGDDGTFSFRGNAPIGKLRLNVSAEQLLPLAPIEFSLGTTDLVVTVDSGTPVAASVLLPDDSPTEYVTLALVPAGAKPAPKPGPGSGSGNDRLVCGLEPDVKNRHDARWPAVPPGNYTLEVRLWAVAQPIVTVPDVVLPLAEQGDPRLVDIDLRPLVRVVTLKIHDGNGQVMDDPDGVVFAAAQPGADEWLGYHFWSSQPRLLLPPGPYDLLVCASGHRPQPLRGNADAADVRQQPWPTLTVHVPDVPTLPAKTRVNVQLAPTEKTEGRYRTPWSSGPRSEYVIPPERTVPVVDGKAEVPIGDGMHEVKVSVSGNRKHHFLTGHEPDRVLPTAGEIRLAIPAAQWQKALAAVAPPAK